jgi:hypothetical protein
MQGGRHLTAAIKRLRRAIPQAVPPLASTFDVGRGYLIRNGLKTSAFVELLTHAM